MKKPNLGGLVALDLRSHALAAEQHALALNPQGTH